MLPKAPSPNPQVMMVSVTPLVALMTTLVGGGVDGVGGHNKAGLHALFNQGIGESDALPEVVEVQGDTDWQPFFEAGTMLGATLPS